MPSELFPARTGVSQPAPIDFGVVPLTQPQRPKRVSAHRAMPQAFRWYGLFTIVLAAIVSVSATLAQAGGIRVVTYNIDADTGVSTPRPGLDTVLQAIGNVHLAGNVQPIDVLALQELYFTPSTTLQPLVAQLNAIYGPGVYTYDTFIGATNGNVTGNGPNGLVYNSSTIQVLQAVGIGTASTSGAPRQPIRYKLHPIGYSSAADFYLYVSHYKASSGGTNPTRRNFEATEIRADADALGPSAHIIYAGDFNLTGGSSEAAYQTLIAAGNAQAHDPVNAAGNWANSASFVGLCTESATTLNARFDFLLVSGAVLNQTGLQLVNNTYTAFGNNGSTPFGGNVSSGSNTALADLANRATVLSLLTTVTDHLPVVADFTIVDNTPPPPPTNVSASPNPVCNGSPTTLSATVPPGQTVDWFTGSCGGTSVGTGTSLSVSPSASATYFARARIISSGISSTTCGSALVTVNQPASIGLQPQPKVVCNGGTATFTTTAAGTAPFTFLWRKNGVPIDTVSNPSAATPALSLTNARNPDAGLYSCTITNSCAAVTSQSASLTVCLGDFNCDGFVTGEDFDAYVGAFDAGDAAADFDRDGFVTGEDFDAFVSAFESGC